MRFDDPAREWRTAREGCAVFVASFRRFLAVTGPDRLSFLHGMLSNDVKGLGPGHGIHAMLLNEMGKVVSDLRAYEERERFLLDTLACRTDEVRAGLERFLIADEVELTVLKDDIPLLGLEGPLAGAVAAEVLGVERSTADPLTHRSMAFQGQPLRVIVASEIRGSGVLFAGEPALAAPLLDACCEAGARALGMDALNVLRLEAGVPWAGVDMDESVLVIEAGLDHALSFSKGCYLGQEVVERIMARGHVNRRLVGVIVDGPDVPAAGATVHVGDRDVGYVTSAARSIALDRTIALGMVHRKHAAPGEHVGVKVGATSVSAVVSDLPFHTAPTASEEGE